MQQNSFKIYIREIYSGMRRRDRFAEFTETPKIVSCETSRFPVALGAMRFITVKQADRAVYYRGTGLIYC